MGCDESGYLHLPWLCPLPSHCASPLPLQMWLQLPGSNPLCCVLRILQLNLSVLRVFLFQGKMWLRVITGSLLCSQGLYSYTLSLSVKSWIMKKQIVPDFFHSERVSRQFEAIYWWHWTASLLTFVQGIEKNEVGVKSSDFLLFSGKHLSTCLTEVWKTMIFTVSF